jgi:hypothetical protein
MYFVKIKKGKNRVKSYFINDDEYDSILEEQGFACAICGNRDGNAVGFALCVDHCHMTGRVRGLLCVKCNLLIGHADENPATLKSAGEYLEINCEKESPQ